VGTRLKAILKRLLGPFAGFNGGFDPRAARFAGRLTESGLGMFELVAIYNSLIFRNGVRKTTTHGRNFEVIGALLDQGRLTLPESIRVLDLGASAGLDALATYRRLTQVTNVETFVLGDFFTEILVDTRHVYDQDGVLMQRRLAFGFVNRFFSCSTPYQRLAALPQQLLAWLATVGQKRASVGLKRVELWHPDVRSEPGAPFTMQRMDVFAPLPTLSYDLIICLHLLVDRYFSSSAIEAAIRNLQQALRVGGTVITGANERVRLIRRTSETEFVSETLETNTPD
jgi:hypothetical protein